MKRNFKYVAAIFTLLYYWFFLFMIVDCSKTISFPAITRRRLGRYVRLVWSIVCNLVSSAFPDHNPSGWYHGTQCHAQCCTWYQSYLLVHQLYSYILYFLYLLCTIRGCFYMSRTAVIFCLMFLLIFPRCRVSLAHALEITHNWGNLHPIGNITQSVDELQENLLFCLALILL